MQQARFFLSQIVFTLWQDRAKQVPVGSRAAGHFRHGFMFVSSSFVYSLIIMWRVISRSKKAAAVWRLASPERSSRGLGGWRDVEGTEIGGGMKEITWTWERNVTKPLTPSYARKPKSTLTFPASANWTGFTWTSRFSRFRLYVLKTCLPFFLCRLVETAEPKQEAVRLQKPQAPLQLLKQVCEDTEKVWFTHPKHLYQRKRIRVTNHNNNNNKNVRIFRLMALFLFHMNLQLKAVKQKKSIICPTLCAGGYTWPLFSTIRTAY